MQHECNVRRPNNFSTAAFNSATPTAIVSIQNQASQATVASFGKQSSNTGLVSMASLASPLGQHQKKKTSRFGLASGGQKVTSASARSKRMQSAESQRRTRTRTNLLSSGVPANYGTGQCNRSRSLKQSRLFVDRPPMRLKSTSHRSNNLSREREDGGIITINMVTNKDQGMVKMPNMQGSRTPRKRTSLSASRNTSVLTSKNATIRSKSKKAPLPGT